MHMMSRRKKMAQDAMTGNEPIKHDMRSALTTRVQCPCIAEALDVALERGRCEKIHGRMNIT